MKSYPDIKQNSKSNVGIRKVLITLVILVLAVSVTFLVQQSVQNIKSTLDSRTRASESLEILSSPPQEIKVNEEYFYIVRVNNPEGVAFKIEAIVLPSWLTLDAGAFKLQGIPKDNAVGENYVLLSISDREGLIKKEFPFVITVLSVSTVKGIYTENKEQIITTVDPKDTCYKYYEENGPLGILAEHPECRNYLYTVTSQVQGASDTRQTISDSSTQTSTFESKKVESEVSLLGIKIGENDYVWLAFFAVLFVGFGIFFIWFLFIRRSTLFPVKLWPKKEKKVEATPKGQKKLIKGEGEDVIIWG